MDSAILIQTCCARQDGMPQHFINAPTSLMTASQDEGDIYLYKKGAGRELKLQTKSRVGLGWNLADLHVLHDRCTLVHLIYSSQ